jgi:Zn-dependent peptidase ImmA (M78 family)
MANTVFKGLNVHFYWDKIYYTDEYIPIDYCDLFDAYFINSIDVSQISTKEQKIVVFLQYENQCRNLLGCGHYKGILQKESRIWVYLYNEPFGDGFVLAHELAHILGAGHVFDGTLMSPSASMTYDWSFSKESEEEILDTLDDADL